MEPFKAKYKEEAIELIAAMERLLLQMETSAETNALVEQVFRDMHTLKGNSSMFGLNIIADFTHQLESVYELIRSGKMKMSRIVTDLTFAALDHLSMLVNNDSILNPQQEQAHKQLYEKMARLSGSLARNNEKDDLSSPGEIPEDVAALKTWHIQFKPHENFLFNGSNPLLIINELQAFGKCLITANTSNIPSLEDCIPDSCYISWDIQLTTEAALPSVKEVFQHAAGRCTLSFQEVPPTGLCTIATAEPDNSPDYLDRTEVKGTCSTSRAMIDQDAVIRPKQQLISSIRVPSERLDNMMSLVSELMTLQAKLGALTEQNPQAELLAVSENLEKISTRLRNNAFSMCLLPIQNMVTPFHRLVRDLAAELKKEIEFVTEGTETELDKNIMEGLSDPIMHLLRNSIDHGIEDPDVRVSSGKSRQGKILLSAYCAGSSVFIEIQDDGKGIDPMKIRNKAIQKGIISSEEVLPEKELLNLIFLPGFSTAENVSKTSGRGVGMDVVKRKIADIRGQIKINSKINTGTTITIKLPITVSIIDGLLVKINAADFVIPLSVVDRCHELPLNENLNRFTNVIVLDGEQIPFLCLGEVFGKRETSLCNQELVIVYFDEKKVGLIVDCIVGKFQAVLKPLGKYFQQMDYISGATILGDGKIALVLDTNNVTEQFLTTKRLTVATARSGGMPGTLSQNRAIECL